MPLIIVAETENWRKIRDMSGDEAWIHRQGLSGRRAVISRMATPIHKRAKTDSRIKRIAEPDVILYLKACEEDGWCAVETRSGQKGWVERSHIWGADPFD